MSNFAIICAAIICIGALLVMLERIRLRQFWSRACTGRLWRRRFPVASKTEIREFLNLFIDSFGFSPSRRLCFAPDDRPIEVYRAVYPFPKLMADMMELETFCLRAEERYGVDLQAIWREDITLGELFQHTRNSRPGGH
jgi:hypothetical protein